MKLQKLKIGLQFHITHPNGMNQIFPCRLKYNI